jgi:hypothetical protein
MSPGRRWVVAQGQRGPSEGNRRLAVELAGHLRMVRP